MRSRISEYSVRAVADATGRGRRQQVDAAVGGSVQRPAALDLEAHQGPPRVVDRAALRVGAEALEVLLGQVDPAPVEVLGDVAEEVGELERVAEVARGRQRRRRLTARGSAASSRRSPRPSRPCSRAGRPRSRTRDTVRSIAIDARKRRKQSGSMSKARTVWTTALSTGSSERPRRGRRRTGRRARRAPRARPRWRRDRGRPRCRRRAGRTRRAPTRGGASPAAGRGRPVVGRAVPPVERPAPCVALARA